MSTPKEVLDDLMERNELHQLLLREHPDGRVRMALDILTWRILHIAEHSDIRGTLLDALRLAYGELA